MIISSSQPIYAGTIAGVWTPATGANLTTDQFGLDTIRRPYQFLTADYKRLLPPKYSSDSEFPKMYRTSATRNDGEGLMSRGELIYTGLSGDMPDPNYEDDKALQSVSLKVSIDYSELGEAFTYDVNLQYRAPQTVWKWIEDSLPAPDKPRYTTMHSTSNPWDQENIVLLRAEVGGTDATAFATLAGVFTLLKGRGVIERFSGYHITELVKNKYWGCQSTTERVIDPTLGALTIIV